MNHFLIESSEFLGWEKKKNAENLWREVQIKRNCRTYCCSEGPDPGNLCFPGHLVLVDPLWARKRRNWGVAAPGQCDELVSSDGLSSLGRTLFLTNTEDTSPSR